MWLLTKPNLWLRELGSFLSLVIKLQLLINNLGFPFMFMWLKIGNELLCYNYSYNEFVDRENFDNLKRTSLPYVPDLDANLEWACILPKSKGSITKCGITC